jgi:hypothetical protein
MDCLYDPEKPVDVQERLAARYCPLGRFPATDEEVEIAREADRTAGPCCGG